MALLLPLAAGAAELSEVGDARAGEALYATFCATCHGREADGRGPTAEVMVLPPPDLTGLLMRNDGVFPIARVVAQIDGRDPLMAHGGPMPPFGQVFEGEDTLLKTATGEPLLTSRPVADLVAWLRSVQARP
ncbi:MAG: cytochrome c [Pseudomonadota bacterium]